MIPHLPFFAHHFGSNAHPFLIELLSQNFDLEVLSRYAGQLLCVFDKKTKIVRKVDVKNSIIEEVLVCKICSGDDSRSTAFKNLQVKTLFHEMLQKFIGHSDKQVQINVIKSLLVPMSNHGFIDADCASLWLHCLDGSDETIADSFSHHIQHVVKEGNEEVIIERLEEAKARTLASKNGFQTIFCRCIKNINRVEASEGFKKRLFQIAFDLMVDKRTHVSISMISKELKAMMNANPSHSTIQLAQVMCASKSPKQIVELVTTVYRISNLRQFIEKQLPLLVTIVILQSCQKEVRPVLDYLAKILDKKVRILLADNFSLIFSKLVTQVSDTEEYQKCTKFIEDTIKIPMSLLVQSDRQNVINELLVNFSSYPKRTFTAFAFIAKHDNDFKNSDKKLTREKLANYIRPRFLGVLNFFDQRLKDQNVGNNHKEDIMKSLVEIIKLMGSEYVGNVKHKIFSTLNIGLTVPNIEQNLLVDTWQSFICTISVNALVPIIGQVIACLIQLYHMESAPKKKVVSICLDLLKNNREALKNSFEKLNFIPEEEGLMSLCELIKIENGIGSKITEFKKILKLVANSLDNENNSVKILTLKKLFELLRLNQESLQSLILCNEEVDPIIADLITKLLECVRSSDSKVTVQAGACLGALGAVDPGRIHFAENLNQGFFATHLSILDEKFVEDLIQVLVKAFLSFSDPGAADSCSYSIQEILRAYKIKNTSGIWKRLEERTKEVLVPLFTSHYSINDDKGALDIRVPIYRSTPDQNFSRWISLWSSHLMTKIEDKQIFQIFQACKPVIRKDAGCAQFLLPYILGHVICHGKQEDINDIVMEVEAIVGGQESVVQVATLNGTILSERSEQTSTQSVAQDLSWMAKQTIFAVLDHMNKWLRMKYLILTKKRQPDQDASVIRDEEYLAVQNFVQRIQQHNLALASFEIKCYARSLMHLEAHLRQHPNDLEQCMTKLQQVYGALDEPDYVRGLAAVRNPKPTLEELIHHHQVTGDFEDAIACYESMGNELNNTLELKSGLLKCYLEMNRPHTASMLVKGMIERDPQHKGDLVKYQIESAWNLGRWGEVLEEDHHLKQTARCWSTNLAKTLLLCHQNDSTSLDQQVAVMRKDLMIPVSAAAMEQGAYRRSYEYLVKLQILDEIESWSMAKTTEDLNKLFCHWTTRQTYSQYSISNLEPVLKVRRALLDISLKASLESDSKSKADLLKRQLGDCWLMSAKVARKAGQLNKAYNLLLEAEHRSNKDVFIERAKLAWARSNPNDAIITLENGIRDQYPALVRVNKEVVNSYGKEDLSTCGQGKLLYARYVDEAATLGPNPVAACYNEAKLLLRQNEDVHCYSARFFDKSIGKNYEASDLDAKGDIIAHIITQYCRSLTYGCEHLHQSLARLLSLWLDYGSRVYLAREAKKGKKKILDDMQKAFCKMNEMIERFVKTSPSYYFLSVFPQLTSRYTYFIF